MSNGQARRAIRPGFVTNEHHTTQSDHGSSIAVMFLHTQEAADWMREHVQVPDWVRCAKDSRIPIERRYVGDVVTALDEAMGVEYAEEEVNLT